MIVPIPLIHVKINVKVSLDINKLINQLKSNPVAAADTKIKIGDEIKVSDDVSVTVSNIQLVGSLSMVKTTNQPSKQEMAVIQAARGNRPYNSISDVKIHYTGSGNISSIEWTES